MFYSNALFHYESEVTSWNGIGQICDLEMVGKRWFRLCTWIESERVEEEPGGGGNSCEVSEVKEFTNKTIPCPVAKGSRRSRSHCHLHCRPKRIVIIVTVLTAQMNRIVINM